MRGLLSTLAAGVLITSLAGCQSQTASLSNPFLAPDRVPPPPTRTIAPGTAQPYYPGQVPNVPTIGTPGFAPGAPQPGFMPTPATPTFAPQPAGTVPPGGWNNTPSPVPSGSSSRNVLPSNIQPASAAIPREGQAPIQIQPDQHSLRFDTGAPLYQQPVVPATTGQTLPPDPSILPTPQQGRLTDPNQFASFQQPLPTAEQREVRIRAISSNNLPTGNGAMSSSPRSRDGFRPQGSNQVRKPTLLSRLEPRKRELINETPSTRYGFDPQYVWLRGQLEYSSATGQWSLRYLPGQPTDAFGGSLAIANSQVLSGLQPGDFVQLRGQVNQQTSTYQVSVVQRQRI